MSSERYVNTAVHEIRLVVQALVDLKAAVTDRDMGTGIFTRELGAIEEGFSAADRALANLDMVDPTNI